MEQKTIRERLEGVTVTDSEGNQKSVYTFIEEQDNSEIEKVKRREIFQKSVGINPTITTKFNQNISGKRSQRKDFTREISSEILANANFELHSKGGNRMFQDRNAEPTSLLNQEGGIELSLKDAQKKERFYFGEASRNQKEAAKWQEVATQLQNALNILSGKVVYKADSPGSERFGRNKKSWWPIVEEKLAQGPTTRKELQAFLLEKGSPSPMSAYQTVHLLLKKEKLKVVNGKIEVVNG